MRLMNVTIQRNIKIKVDPPHPFLTKVVYGTDLFNYVLYILVLLNPEEL